MNKQCAIIIFQHQRILALIKAVQTYRSVSYNHILDSWGALQCRNIIITHRQLHQRYATLTLLYHILLLQISHFKSILNTFDTHTICIVNIDKVYKRSFVHNNFVSTKLHISIKLITQIKCQIELILHRVNYNQTF